MSARPPRRSLTIGAVLATLRQDFPDVTISKIRFLEAEGLVTPARTASGYRTYSESDVQRLHYVLTAQRDHFWPLKVIREALDALDQLRHDLRPFRISEVEIVSRRYRCRAYCGQVAATFGNQQARTLARR